MHLNKIFAFSVGPIGGAVLSLMTLPIVAWFFSTEDIGRLTMLQVIISFCVMLFSLSMHQAYVREYHEENDKSLLLKMAIMPGVLLLVVTIAVLSIIPFSISEFLFQLDSESITIALLINVVAAFFINFLSHALRMEERGFAFSITLLIPKALFLIFIGLIVLRDEEYAFKDLMFANAAATFLSLISFAYFTSRTLLPVAGLRIKMVLLVKMLKFSLPLVVGGLAYWSVTAMDRFFLRALSNFEELGIYAVAVSFSGAAVIVSTIFSNLWHPIVYRWINEGIELEKIRSVTESVFLLIAFMWTMAGLFSWVVTCLLPTNYSAVEYLLVVCMAMPFFQMLSETTVVGVGVTRRSSFSMLASILAFVVNGVCNYMLIPSYGALGAAIASAVAFYIFFIVRTEASAYLWVSFPRKNIYILMTLYLLASIGQGLIGSASGAYHIIWLLLFALSLFVFKKRASILIMSFNTMLMRGH